MIIFKVFFSKFVPIKLPFKMKYIFLLLFTSALLASCSVMEDCPNYSKADNQIENLNS